jgi:hypothetical protein
MCLISGVKFANYSFCWVLILCCRLFSTWRKSKTDATTFILQPTSLRLPKRKLESKRNWVCCNASDRGPALTLCTDCFLNSDPDQLVYHRDHLVDPLDIVVVSVKNKGCQVSGMTRLRTPFPPALIPLPSICRFLTQKIATSLIRLLLGVSMPAVGNAGYSRSVPHTCEGLGDSGIPEIRR